MSVRLTFIILLSTNAVVVKRAGKAALSGVDYEKKLVESLNSINAKSKCLMEEATKSHIHNFHLCKFNQASKDAN